MQLRPQRTELLENLQDVNVNVTCEEKRLQCADVLVDLLVMLKGKQKQSFFSVKKEKAKNYKARNWPCLCVRLCCLDCPDTKSQEEKRVCAT